MREQFIARATELGAAVHEASDLETVVELVVGIFRSANARVAVLAPDLGGVRTMMVEGLAGAGAEFVEDPSPESVSRADVGVTLAALAVAETGSILVAGNDLLPRLASMLPLVHVALVDSDYLVPSLDEAGEFLRRLTLQNGPEAMRYASFVSGPSRTADVEKTLSTGVHGPRELHIIIV